MPTRLGPVAHCPLAQRALISITAVLLPTGVVPGACSRDFRTRQTCRETGTQSHRCLVQINPDMAELPEINHRM